jgi:hypothetical protein
MIKLSKITPQIRLIVSSLSLSHVHYSCFKYCVLILFTPQNVEIEPLRNKATYGVAGMGRRGMHMGYWWES